MKHKLWLLATLLTLLTLVVGVSGALAERPVPDDALEQMFVGGGKS